MSKISILCKISLALTPKITFVLFKSYDTNVYRRLDIDTICIFAEKYSKLLKKITFYFWLEYHHAVNMVSDSAELQVFF